MPAQGLDPVFSSHCIFLAEKLAGWYVCQKWGGNWELGRKSLKLLIRDRAASSLMQLRNFNHIRCTYIQAVSTRMPNQMRTWYICKSAMYPLVLVWVLGHLVPSYAGRFINSVTDGGGLPDTSFRIKIQKDCFPCGLISPRCKSHFAC